MANQGLLIPTLDVVAQDDRYDIQNAAADTPTSFYFLAAILPSKSQVCLIIVQNKKVIIHEKRGVIGVIKWMRQIHMHACRSLESMLAVEIHDSLSQYIIQASLA